MRFDLAVARNEKSVIIYFCSAGTFSDCSIFSESSHNSQHDARDLASTDERLIWRPIWSRDKIQCHPKHLKGQFMLSGCLFVYRLSDSDSLSLLLFHTFCLLRARTHTDPRARTQTHTHTHTYSHTHTHTHQKHNHVIWKQEAIRASPTFLGQPQCLTQQWEFHHFHLLLLCHCNWVCQDKTDLSRARLWNSNVKTAAVLREAVCREKSCLVAPYRRQRTGFEWKINALCLPGAEIMAGWCVCFFYVFISPHGCFRIGFLLFYFLHFLSIFTVTNLVTRNSHREFRLACVM